MHTTKRVLHLSYLIRIERFTNTNVLQNMHKNALFLLKNCRNRPALFAPRPPMASGVWEIRSQIPNKLSPTPVRILGYATSPTTSQIHSCILSFSWSILETVRYHFLKPISIFSKKSFTDIWTVADILLTTDTDILKFASRYIYRYFNEVFWLKLVEIAYTSSVHFNSSVNQCKCVYITAKIAKQ